MHIECPCGAVGIDTPCDAPLHVYFCHCRDCQKQSGSAFQIVAIFTPEPLRACLLDPESPAALQLTEWSRPADSGRTLESHNCKTCGMRVYSRIRLADGTYFPTVLVGGGLVRGLDCRTGAFHIYASSAVLPIPEGVEKYEFFPPRERII